MCVCVGGGRGGSNGLNNYLGSCFLKHCRPNGRMTGGSRSQYATVSILFPDELTKSGLLLTIGKVYIICSICFW